VGQPPETAQADCDEGIAGATREKEPLGRRHHQREPSVRLCDYIVHIVQAKSPSTRSSQPRHTPGTAYPITHYVNCANFSARHRQFLAVITAEREPVTFSEAVKDERWRTAMHNEIQALENNGTWEVAYLPSGKKALGYKWFYKIKYHSDGTVEQYKARLVILGNHQVEEIDYIETFSPVAKMVTVRNFLAIAAAQNWEIH